MWGDTVVREKDINWFSGSSTIQGGEREPQSTHRYIGQRAEGEPERRVMSVRKEIDVLGRTSVDSRTMWIKLPATSEK